MWRNMKRREPLPAWVVYPICRCQAWLESGGRDAADVASRPCLCLPITPRSSRPRQRGHAQYAGRVNRHYNVQLQGLMPDARHVCGYAGPHAAETAGSDVGVARERPAGDRHPGRAAPEPPLRLALFPDPWPATNVTCIPPPAPTPRFSLLGASGCSYDVLSHRSRPSTSRRGAGSPPSGDMSCHARHSLTSWSGPCISDGGAQP